MSQMTRIIYIYILVFIFLTKFFARSKLFKYIKEKYGHNIIQQAKVRDDIEFLLRCKKEALVPLFAIPKLSIKSTWNLIRKIAKLIIEVEIKNKHKIKRHLDSRINGLWVDVSSGLSFVVFKHNIGVMGKNKRMKWLKIHEKSSMIYGWLCHLKIHRLLIRFRQMLFIIFHHVC